MVGEVFAAKLEDHLFTNPELFLQDERSLMLAIRGFHGNKPHGIGPTENRLRIAFWMEYDRAIMASDAKMYMPRVHGGVCSSEYFYQVVIRKPEKVAWMLCPPASYTKAMEEALTFGIEKLRDILEFPLYNKKGEPDTKVGELILKAVEKLDIRQKGAIIQRVQTMNLHKHVSAPAAPEPQESMEEVDERLKHLEKRAKESGLPAAPIIDVTPSRLRPDGQ